MPTGSNLELEKKYILKPDLWRNYVVDPAGEYIEQYYIVDTITAGIAFPFVSRIRIVDGKEAFLTTKIGLFANDGRVEVESPMNLEIAKKVVGTIMPPSLVKRRFKVPIGQGAFEHALTLEVDVFEGFNTGLVIGEVEFPTEFEMSQPLNCSVIATEIEKESDLYKATLNSNLVKTPFRNWRLGIKGRYLSLQD